jgi:hypothetical protein
VSRLRRWHLALRANRDHLLGLALFGLAAVGVVAALVGLVVVVVAGVGAILGDA